MIYTYRAATGETHELSQSMKLDVPAVVEVEGVRYERVWDVPVVAVQGNNPHAMKWSGFGGLPVSVSTPADDRTNYKEGTFDGHKVRDYGDGTFATWERGIRIVHNERSDKYTQEVTGMHRE